LPLPQCQADPWPAGGQSPRPAPAPPQAGVSRPPGRALASAVPGSDGLRGSVSSGRGNAGRVSCSRPEWRQPRPRFNGRGHRPCHSATPISGPAGGQSPRPAPAPPLAGASRPPGRALAFRGARTHRSTGQRPARAGKRGSRFLIPPEQAKALPPRQWQGPSPLPPCYADIRTSWGPKAPGQRPPRPRRALRPRRVGRWPLCLPELPVYSGPFRSGGGNAGRVSRSRPEGRQHPHRFNGRGHRPCHSAALGSGPAGGQSPRPAPAPPPAGASRPPGRALASVFPGPAGRQGAVARGRGNAGRVS